MQWMHTVPVATLVITVIKLFFKLILHQHAYAQLFWWMEYIQMIHKTDICYFIYLFTSNYGKKL